MVDNYVEPPLKNLIQFDGVALRHDIAAGNREARREKEAREASKWDILDSTHKSWDIFG